MPNTDKDTSEWISVAEYARRKNLRTPQVVYNWIATNKLKKNKDWRARTIKVVKKEVLWKE